MPKTNQNKNNPELDIIMTSKASTNCKHTHIQKSNQRMTEPMSRVFFHQKSKQTKQNIQYIQPINHKQTKTNTRSVKAGCFRKMAPKTHSGGHFNAPSSPQNNRSWECLVNARIRSWGRHFPRCEWKLRAQTTN